MVGTSAADDGTAAIRIDADGRLDVVVRDIAKTRLVEELRRCTGTAIHVRGPLPGRVTASFHGLPLDLALRSLLGADAGLVLLYGPDLTARRELPAEVWIISGERSGEESAGDSATPGAEPVLGALHKLEDPEPETRKAALQELADAPDRGVVDALSWVATSDEDHEVRATAVTMLGRIGSPEALLTLGRVLKDPEPAVRFHALDRLRAADGPLAAALAREALHDPDEGVRAAAAADRETGPEAGVVGEDR